MITVTLYAAIATLMFIHLSLRVIFAREKEQVLLGTGGNQRVERAMRNQANFAEYVPLTLLLLSMAAINGLPTFLIHGFGSAMIVSRIFHFIGFSRNNSPFALRVIGTVLTLSLLLILAGVLLAQVNGMFPILTQNS